MAETLFSKIISGQIPSFKIYEDDDVFSFLDINPVAPGHTLVVPKEPAQTLDQLSEKSAAALGRVLPKLCRAVMKATGTRSYNVLQNNGIGAHQAVFHVHFHIIPKPDSEQGLGIKWPIKPLDPQTGPTLASQIREALES
ncbi:MAG: HIT family protein [Bdellovibrionota bacterium]